MASLEEIRNNRLEKLKTLKEKGVNPYPAISDREYSLLQVINDFDELSKRKVLFWLAELWR